MTQLSSRLTPQSGERLSYLIACSPKSQNSNRISNVVRVETFANDPELSIHYNYYVSNLLIPALERFFLFIPDIQINWHNIAYNTCLA